MTGQAYQGSCQCGAVTFDAVVDMAGIIACNCSRCGRVGHILSFTPREQFTLKSGGESLTAYDFNKHAIHHQFCKVCGVQPFAYGEAPDGASMVAVNVRCLDGIDANMLDPKKVDGKSF